MSRHGWMIECAGAPQLISAARGLRKIGFRQLQAYTPYPVPGLVEALEQQHHRVPLAVLIGGMIGGFGTLAMEYYAATVALPINVGGRPNASWPAFLPPALEMVFLGAVVFGVLMMLFGDRLPRFYHPVFNVDHFTKASRAGYFLVLRAEDPLVAELGEQTVREWLDGLDTLNVDEVVS